MVSFLFSLALLIMGFFFLFVAAWVGYGIFRMIRSGQRNRKYLQAANTDAPLNLAHLSSPLQRLVRDTRLLRISLEAPVRDIGDYIDADVGRKLAIPSSVVEDVETFDTMLMNVTRQLADWVQTIDQLSPQDRDMMLHLGASPESIRHALHVEGWAFERRNLRPRGRPPMHRRLANIASELAKIESTMQLSERVYR